MNCPDCGQENIDAARFCVNCGYQFHPSRGIDTVGLAPTPAQSHDDEEPAGDLQSDSPPPPPDFGQISSPMSATPHATSPLPHTADTKEFAAADFLLMVVDDTPDNLILISLELQRSGFRVITASNGEEALKLAEASPPDLIVMDIGMPTLDGLAATRRLREHPTLGGVRVVALTAFSTEGFRRAAYDAGIDGYLTKPVDFERLGELIRSLLPVR